MSLLPSVLPGRETMSSVFVSACGAGTAIVEADVMRAAIMAFEKCILADVLVLGMCVGCCCVKLLRLM